MRKTKRGNPTNRQQQVLSAIQRLTKQGRPPTLRELMAELDISSPNGMESHLKPLRAKGLVTWEKGKSRTLRVIEPKGIPILDLRDERFMKAVDE